MSEPKVDRRTAIRWAASVAAMFHGGMGAFAMSAQASQPARAPTGYGLDPNLIDAKAPWPRILDADQRQRIIALCDFLLPAENAAPSASQIGVHDLIDEWVSAPYPEQVADRDLILMGLDWMNEAARKLGAASFNNAPASVRMQLLERLARPGEPYAPSGFYRKVRKLTIGGYYTTAEGFKDIGYIGNVALTAFPEPSADVLAALDRAYDVLGL